ncbi:hypothetical protein M758_9G052300 [Ceratodon purpureus]|nr:hypothetical protein M758_9G052300 [Ceratodon purpureus]
MFGTQVLECFASERHSGLGERGSHNYRLTSLQLTGDALTLGKNHRTNQVRIHLSPPDKVCIMILLIVVSVFACMGWIVSVPECVAQVGFRVSGGLHSELFGFLSLGFRTVAGGARVGESWCRELEVSSGNSVRELVGFCFGEWEFFVLEKLVVLGRLYLDTLLMFIF